MTADAFRAELESFQGWFPRLFLKDLAGRSESLSLSQREETIKILGESRAVQSKALEEAVSKLHRVQTGMPVTA